MELRNPGWLRNRGGCSYGIEVITVTESSWLRLRNRGYGFKIRGGYETQDIRGFDSHILPSGTTIKAYAQDASGLAPAVR
eukprot:1322634-Amorphochlora_amoeboformis.AAC.1